MDQEWDYLLILDACRYDIFKEVVDIDGDLDYVISQGSHRDGFCNANFAGKRFYDTVYVTANGYGARIGQNVFHDLIFTGEEFAGEGDSDAETFDDIHPKLNALLPSTVHEAALAARNEYPDKRIIVHFMQPHQPYLGTRAKKLRERLEKDGILIKTKNPEKFEEQNNSGKEMRRMLAQAAQNKYITKTEFREIYIGNLQFVLDYVKSLNTSLEGKKSLQLITAIYWAKTGFLDILETGTKRN